ncbi:MAG: carbohydrate ABC transporter permease [Alphaproteobacteria bacterium]|jgi:trehalose/maltose transport system permease protein|nr:carbohydrate ABC transporter permease [Alphaproteobacteria bacterium]MBT5390388.1 carbohydrate ABC transporter permease [Alphaproteobacteria bacterium]MBT5654221.1 carbohydrate ABC transporter permease [Alphaproteobacteria bacterium]
MVIQNKRKYIPYVLSFIIVLVSVFPFYWAIVTSFKSGSDLFTTHMIPGNPTWENYISVFREQPFGRNILNSTFVATSTVVLSLFVAICASYAFGRVAFRGKKYLLFTILMVCMFPQVALLSGMFELIHSMKLYNNTLSLVFSYITFTLPFTIWILTTFMREIPRDIEDAAIIDGASPFIICVRIFLPILKPALVTTGLLAFIAAWNEFLFALTFTLTNTQQTVPVAIALMSGANQHELPWGQIMAASVVVTVPLILLVLFFQRRIVSGLTAGAVKG